MNIQNDRLQYRVVHSGLSYRATLSKIRHYSYPGLLTRLAISKQAGRLHRDGKPRYTKGLFGVTANHTVV